jgi:hypothetical protein
MQLDRRRLIIAAIAIGLLIAVLLGGWWYQRSRPGSAPPSPLAAPPASEQTPAAGSQSAVPVRVPEERGDESVKRLARLFAERFGTFSNQSRYEAFVDLRLVTTARFQRWLTEQYLPELQRRYPADRYAGETTRALNVTVTRQARDSGVAEVVVQQEVTEGEASRVSYRTLVVEVVRQNGEWLVDVATWR